MGRVGAVHVQRRIGFGKAAPLRLGQGRGIGVALFAHAGQDEVAGAIEDALDGRDLVGGETLRQGGDDGDAAADAGLEGDGPAMAPASVEHLLAMLRQQRLIGGHYILARSQQIEHRGIARLQEIDLPYSRELGYTIKLLAEAWLNDRQLALHVSPALVRQQAPLAQVRGAYNAILVVGDAVGDTLYYGMGAGQMPTASAVVADIIDMAVGRAQRTFQTLRLWSGNGSDIQVCPSSAVRSRFYLRTLVQDRPGVLADIAQALAKHKISIASVIQHEALGDEEGGSVPLVIMTHTALTGDFRAAVNDIDRLSCTSFPSVYYPVAD